jgi:hypothetical protein
VTDEAFSNNENENETLTPNNIANINNLHKIHEPLKVPVPPTSQFRREATTPTTANSSPISTLDDIIEPSKRARKRARLGIRDSTDLGPNPLADRYFFKNICIIGHSSGHFHDLCGISDILVLLK